jgi:hypothetical protein
MAAEWGAREWGTGIKRRGTSMGDWNAGQALCRWTVVAGAVSLLGFSLPDSAHCGLQTKEEKLTYKKNKEAMDKVPVKRGGK